MWLAKLGEDGTADESIVLGGVLGGHRADVGIEFFTLAHDARDGIHWGCGWKDGEEVLAVRSWHNHEDALCGYTAAAQYAGCSAADIHAGTLLNQSPFLQNLANWHIFDQYQTHFGRSFVIRISYSDKPTIRVRSGKLAQAGS
jgi:hypothetical protein